MRQIFQTLQPPTFEALRIDNNGHLTTFLVTISMSFLFEFIYKNLMQVRPHLAYLHKSPAVTGNFTFYANISPLKGWSHEALVSSFYFIG
jgi:hypothetical protein